MVYPAGLESVKPAFAILDNFMTLAFLTNAGRRGAFVIRPSGAPREPQLRRRVDPVVKSSFSYSSIGQFLLLMSDVSVPEVIDSLHKFAKRAFRQITEALSNCSKNIGQTLRLAPGIVEAEH